MSYNTYKKERIVLAENMANLEFSIIDKSCNKVLIGCSREFLMPVRLLYGVGGEEEVANSGEQSVEADTGSTSIYTDNSIVWGI